MHRFIRAYDRLIDLTGAAPGYLIGLMALGISAEVASRNAGLGGINWMLELVEYGILAVAMSGTAYVLKIGRHVTVDVLTNPLPPRLRHYTDIAACALALAISAVLFAYGVITTTRSFEAGTFVFKSFTIREWVPIALIPLGTGLLTVECARRLWLSASDGHRPSGGASEGL